MAPWPAGLGEAMLALTVQAGACFPSPSDVENEGTAVNGTSFFFKNQILEKLIFFLKINNNNKTFSVWHWKVDMFFSYIKEKVVQVFL